MSDKDFVEKYLKDFSSLIKPNDEIIEKILLIKNLTRYQEKKLEYFSFSQLLGAAKIHH